MPSRQKIEQFYGTGRRKDAVARVFLRKGTGQILVNGRGLENFFPRLSHRLEFLKPLVVSERASSYNIKATVAGGGMTGQAGALRLGLARALVRAEEDLHGMMRKAGLLTRDSRVVERKKYGQPGARKKYQYSKR